ncbi:MAG: hypothetical protein HOV97_05815 [Nonomuraea sp.]|nr:hypothetical protein [Nonomuraea sp.]
MARIEAEDFPVVDGLPLRLSFTPEAIREHFEADDLNLDEVDDETLMAVGAAALQDDLLYRAFHDALTWALSEHGIAVRAEE